MNWEGMLHFSLSISLDDVSCSGGSIYAELGFLEWYTMLGVGYSHALSLENGLCTFGFVRNWI